MILPGSTIGILGGGQLGRMISVAAANMGYQVVIYCPKASEDTVPAEQVSNKVIYANWDDRNSLKEFAEQVDIITYEFENIPIDSIKYLEGLNKLKPNSKALYIGQNRQRERAFFKENGLPTHKFFEIKSASDLKSAFENSDLNRAILKTSAFGYDGKGQVKLNKNDEFSKIWEKSGFTEAILEEFIDFKLEISVIIARKDNGEFEYFPIGQNIHEDGILKKSIITADISEKVEKEAKKTTRKIADLLDYCGVMAVEYFVTKDDNILINEIAPRVHNSGHWTMDFCSVSQFEQHVRSICGLPLGKAELLTEKAYMKNLIGYDVENLQDEIQETTKLHLYGKKTVKKGRKMGHINYCE